MRKPSRPIVSDYRKAMRQPEDREFLINGRRREGFSDVGGHISIWVRLQSETRAPKDSWVEIKVVAARDESHVAREAADKAVLPLPVRRVQQSFVCSLRDLLASVPSTKK